MSAWRVHTFISTLLLCATLQSAEKSNCPPVASSGTNNAALLEKRREHDRKLSPAEREAKRNEIKQRLEKRLADLREKEKSGTLTEKEKQQLTRSAQLLKRFEQPSPTPK